MTNRGWTLAAALVALTATTADAQDEHWSRQFKKPRGSNKMLPSTGMSDGTNKPVFRKAKWHDGKLWVAGAWECGASGKDTTKAQRNVYWYLWTYAENEGWRPFAYFHSSQGGSGPDGKINDFLWLPDGRLVVAGEFTRLDNPGGNMYHRVDALAVYDPKEPSANKWQPLGTFQMDGTVSPGGSIKTLAYDAQGNDLYMGGSFGGINNERSGRKYPESPSIHRFDLETNSYEPLSPGLQRAAAHRIIVDESTKPSTIYVAGSIRWVGGNGDDPRESGSTARFSTGFASYQEGKGWTPFPAKKQVTSKEGGWDGPLQRAADFKYRDGVVALDALVDGKDIYIVGAFSEGKLGGGPVRGIAKWDWDKELWIDPTGKDGIGREAYSIAKAENGKIYIAGSFGGPTAKGNYDGFKNGDPAAMAAVYDPATKAWSQLGSGIQGRSMPECRLTINGNDVYFIGDFNHVGGEQKIESWYVARWNETVDFTANPAKVDNPPVTGNYDVAPTKPLSSGNEHWSRAFPRPPRATGKKSNMSGKTGMDDGTGAPQISGVVKYGDTLYFCGRWEAERNNNWYVWSHTVEEGWKPVAHEGPKAKVGALSPPRGMKIHDKKLYVYGSITNYAGLGVYDLEAKTWSEFTGKNVKGEPMVGNGDPKKGSPLSNIAWDEKTGDTYLLAGTNGAIHPDKRVPNWTGPVVRVDKDGVYHAMGFPLLPENPGKPVTAYEAIYLDKTKDPVDIYIGGTFNYYGEESSNYARMVYNVAKWSHEEKDWRPIGKGHYLRLSKLSTAKESYPEGLPGLPILPEVFHGFIAAGFPRIRCMTMDSEGNIYAGGTVAVVSGTFPIHERMKEETFGIVKYDAKTQMWGPCTTVGGVSRDVVQMTWLDEGRTKMLLSGDFHYDNAWNSLNSVAVLDTKTGVLSPLGGGLLRKSRGQVISSTVSHFVDGDDWYFAGLFDHAGINEDDMLEAPIQSAYVAHWNGKKSMDPNAGLTVGEVAPIEAPKGFSSKSVKVELTATLDGEGEVLWFEKRSNGAFAQKGKGLKYTANLRVKGTDGDKYFYVCVKRPDGSMGGKMPVRIPVTKP
jgi:hypothetical protein